MSMEGNITMAATQDSDKRVLNDLIISTLALLGQFTSSLNPTSSTPASDVAQPINNPPNPLRVVGDSAKLVKAHTTRLSLLAINKPFTPSAITKVLQELSATCLPAMMSAVQICEQERATWGALMGKEIQARVRRVFKELEMLLAEMQSISAGDGGKARRDSLSSTGVVWESCDALVELEALGIVGLAVQKVEQYRDTIKDAIQELQEWKDGEDLGSEGQTDGLLDSDDEAVDGDRDSIEDMFNAANSMPSDRPELKALVEEVDGKLKKVVILYQAFVKRRIRTFKPSLEQEVLRLDDLMLHMRRIPHQVDELASNFYDVDEDGARQVLTKCIAEAKGASTVVELNWNGEEDEFTAWVKKWSAAVG